MPRLTRTSLHPWAAPLVLLAALGCHPLTPAAGTPFDAAAVGTTVLQAEDRMNEAVDHGDCGTGVGAMTDVAEPLFVSAGHVVRSTASLDSMCRVMVSDRASAHFTPDAITVHPFSNDVAYVVREGSYTVNYTDGRSRTTYLVMTTIWQRTPDGWRCIHLHESSRPMTSS